MGKALESRLAHDEQARAERFRCDRDRRAYVMARAVLRDILARYLAIHPGDVALTAGPCGKPELCGLGPSGTSPPTLRFNVSHSGHLALYAITVDHDVGVDLEQMRPSTRMMLIADRFFSPMEAASLRSLPEPVRQHAFFAWWTRKEAILKAHGVGLSGSLQDVGVPPHWFLQSLRPAPGFAAAVAVGGPPARVLQWTWEPPRDLRAATRLRDSCGSPNDPSRRRRKPHDST